MPNTNQPRYRPGYRWVAALVAAVFAVWRWRVHDPWGLAFGALALLSIGAQPARVEDMTPLRARLLYLMVAAFFALGLAYLFRRIW
jgi:hypothetical protein